MKPSTNTVIACVIGVYAFFALATFGHAYHNMKEPPRGNAPGDKAIISFLVSTMWPLYWSIELQKVKP